VTDKIHIVWHMFNYSVADYQDIDEDRHVILGAPDWEFLTVV